jgi:hypothetical protein
MYEFTETTAVENLRNGDVLMDLPGGFVEVIRVVEEKHSPGDYRVFYRSLSGEGEFVTPGGTQYATEEYS